MPDNTPLRTPRLPAVSDTIGAFDFHGHDHAAIQANDGAQWVSVTQLCRYIGVSSDAARRNIERSSWSQGRTTVLTVQLPGDDRARAHYLIHERVVPMWIANISTNHIRDEVVRANVESYQREFADALYDYVTKGVAINPRVSHEEAAKVIAIFAQAQVGDPGYWDTKARQLAGRVLGEAPEYDPATKPLTVSTYLAEKGITGKRLKSLRASFGKTLKAQYVERFGSPPPGIEDLVDRHMVSVAQYQEQHRPMFDSVWHQLVEDDVA